MRLVFIVLCLTQYSLIYSQIGNMDLVKVEGGDFVMGDTCCYNNRKPIRKIALNTFHIDKYEVTVSQFAKFVSETGYKTDAEKGQGSIILIGDNWTESDSINWRFDSKGERYKNLDSKFPVIHVSWNDANAYCVWLSNKTNFHFRLPTEAEWEYAAKGGQNSSDSIFSGSNDIDEIGWYINNTDVNNGVMLVGTKKSNNLGIYDMTGNVWEWCSDWYNSSYDVNDTINPKGPAEGKRRTSRGGSWRTPAKPQSHITHRNSLNPEKQGNLLGFRVVCSDCID